MSPGAVVEPVVAPVEIFAFVDSPFLFAVVVLPAAAPVFFFPVVVVFQSVAAAFVSVVAAFLFQPAALLISSEVVVLQVSRFVISEWAPAFYLDVPASFFRVAVAYQFAVVVFDSLLGVGQELQVGISLRAVAAC